MGKKITTCASQTPIQDWNNVRLRRPHNGIIVKAYFNLIPYSKASRIVASFSK